MPDETGRPCVPAGGLPGGGYRRRSRAGVLAAKGATLGHHRAEERVLALQAHGVQVADHGAVRLPETGLGVRDALGRAVGRDELLHLA